MEDFRFDKDDWNGKSSEEEDDRCRDDVLDL